MDFEENVLSDTLAESSAAHADEPTGGVIAVSDVEELQYCVDPWQLRMSQQSGGRLQASFAFSRVNGILMTRERWSHKIAAVGLTPQGYAVFAGSCGRSAFSWCGEQIAPGKLAFVSDATEVNFLTSDQEDHWVMLMPLDLMSRHLGPELAVELLNFSGQRDFAPTEVEKLSRLVMHAIDLLQSSGDQGVDELQLDLLEVRLTSAAASCLLDSARSPSTSEHASRRASAFRQALQLLNSQRSVIGVEDLVTEIGVSRRSLEIGFKEAIGISPALYSRQLRLNGLYRDLRRASPLEVTVTQAAGSWGFSELGRLSGYYRQLFGELPSSTLRKSVPPPSERLLDVLK